MANHVIDADAAGMLIAAISDGRRGRARGIHHLRDGIINRFRADAGGDHRCNIVKDTRSEGPCLLHAREILWSMNADAVFGQAAIEIVQVSSLRSSCFLVFQVSVRSGLRVAFTLPPVLSVLCSGLREPPLHLTLYEGLSKSPQIGGKNAFSSLFGQTSICKPVRADLYPSMYRHKEWRR